MTNKKQPEALRLAEMLTADEWPGHVTLVSYARECVAELRRQHARITELEAAPQPAHGGAVPLTVDEIEQLIAQWSYELHGDRARYLVRMTEKHHGIKEGGQHADQ